MSVAQHAVLGFVADVVESTVNAQAIMKTLRSRSRAKRYSVEKLYVFVSAKIATLSA